MKAMVMAGVLAVIGLIGLVAFAVVFHDEISDVTRVAGQDNGVTMTLDEFNQIEAGMTLAQVEGVVGGPGALTSKAEFGGFKSEMYSWDGSGSLGANAIVTFQNERVEAKAQFGLR